MLDMSEYLWATVYVMKQMYDHGAAEKLLAYYGEEELDSDYLYEMSIEAIGSVFSDTRDYYNDEIEVQTFVFFDPAFDAFYEACREYERETGIPPGQNHHRTDIETNVEYALQFNDYSYSYRFYPNRGDGRRCRLALILGCEFGAHYEVPGGLLDILDAFKSHTEQMREEITRQKGQIKMIEFPAAEEERKEAA